MEKKTIIISPYSQKLRNGKNNPKNYPYWDELVLELKKKDFYIIQIGVSGEKSITGVDEVKFNQSLKEIEDLLRNCYVFISVDNFLPHLANCIGVRGIVLWGQSDPDIFGYKENINILKDRKYLRRNQFDVWESCEYNKDSFVLVSNIINSIDIIK